MGIFDKLSSNIAKGIGNAVSKAAENVIAPAAEKLGNKIAEKINEATESLEENKNETNTENSEAKSGLQQAMERLEKAANSYAEKLESLGIDVENDDQKAEFVAVLSFFPKWTATPIKDVDGEETDEYVVSRISIEATEKQVEEYKELLVQNGFSNPGQIQKKIVGDKEFWVDFTFSLDGEIGYCIYKTLQNENW